MGLVYNTLADGVQLHRVQLKQRVTGSFAVGDHRDYLQNSKDE
ncbi:hypothetical protein [Serratia sp. UGAL515B_01]|nr:hypothetical protein [Serratia sp. UGAL515B_01]WON75811.1 hypothetical protein OK023_11045 [Serratia sp. UGAL515B_01]